jgi:D-sedoheptulose 7-phosphate isomerase
MKDARAFVTDYRDRLAKLLPTIDLAKVAEAIRWFDEARRDGRTIFTCGNGGSALTASHLAEDVLKGAGYGRAKRFRILSLADSIGTITAYANDVGYDCVFAEQLKSLAQKGDLVVAISGSGNSPNVVAAIEYANSIGCRTLALTGRDGGKLSKLAQLEIRVADPHMGRIEDAHLVIAHMIAYRFMEEPQ